MEYKIVKGGHRDLYRVYPMLEFDFPDFELVDQKRLHLAFMKGAAEILLLKDERGYEVGYGVIYKKSLYGYVLLAYLGVYPAFRGQGAGKRFLELMREYYAGTQGIFAEKSRGGPELQRRLFASAGFEEVHCHDRSDTGIVLCLRLRGPENLSIAAPLIIRDIYSNILPEHILKCSSAGEIRK